MKYDELSEEAKQKVLRKFHDINIHDQWSDDIITNFKEQLENKFGMTDVKIRFSGFGSQGDGASFTGRLFLDEFVKEINLILDLEEIDNRYVHKNTVKPNYEWVENDLEYWREKKCDEIYSALEDEYNYLISDDTIEERIKELDWDFTEEGIRI